MSAAPRKGSNVAQIKMGIYVISEPFRDTGGFSKKSRIGERRAYSIHGRNTSTTEEARGFFHSILASGKIPGGKDKHRARQAVFVSPLNPFGKDPEEEKPHFDFTVPQKVPYETRWKHYQDAVCWVRLSKTKSFAIMANATIPGHCIDRVTAQNGDRVIVERLATPRPASEDTLKRNWAKAAAAARTAAAAAHFRHRRNETLETEGDLGKLGRSARRLETHHRN